MGPKAEADQINKTSISSRIGRLRPDWDWEVPNYDKQFAKAVKLATDKFLRATFIVQCWVYL